MFSFNPPNGIYKKIVNTFVKIAMTNAAEQVVAADASCASSCARFAIR